jgi:DNA polymerase III subunit epsilon
MSSIGPTATGVPTLTVPASELARSWQDTPLVALDLEGTGAQDRDREAIIEIAVVPLTGGAPDLARAYASLVNPARRIAIRKWTPPGVTNDLLAEAPMLAEIEPQLAARLNGRVVVGHNVGVDWRLLHRRCPAITPAGLVDTLPLARAHAPKPPADGRRGNSLTVLLDRLGLTGRVQQLAGPDSQPHRALWDAVAVPVLLDSLVAHAFETDPTLAELLAVAGLAPTFEQQGRSPHASVGTPNGQMSLLDGSSRQTR